MEFNRNNNSMYFQKTISCFLIILIGASLELVAQKQGVKKAYIPDQIKRMEKMIGIWEGDVHREVGPVVSSAELKVAFDFSRILKDQAIQLSSATEIVSESKKTNGYGVIACDTISNELHLMLLSDSGAVYDLIGKWTNDYAINFSCNTVRKGKKIGITLWLISKVADKLDYSMYTSVGEEILITDKGLLTKK